VRGVVLLRFWSMYNVSLADLCIIRGIIGRFWAGRAPGSVQVLECLYEKLII
jgi:hypothetical protein